MLNTIDFCQILNMPLKRSSQKQFIFIKNVFFYAKEMRIFNFLLKPVFAISVDPSCNGERAEAL